MAALLQGPVAHDPALIGAIEAFVSERTLLAVAAESTTRTHLTGQCLLAVGVGGADAVGLLVAHASLSGALPAAISCGLSLARNAVVELGSTLSLAVGVGRACQTRFSANGCLVVARYTQGT